MFTYGARAFFTVGTSSVVLDHHSTGGREVIDGKLSDSRADRALSWEWRMVVHAFLCASGRSSGKSDIERTAVDIAVKIKSKHVYNTR